MNRTNVEESQARTNDHAGTRRAARPEPEASPRRTLRLERLRDVGKNLGTQLDEQVHKRPYAVLGAALGVGFAAGSVLGSRLGQVLLAAGLGYVAKQFFGQDLSIEKLQATLEKLASEAERRATPS